MTTISTRTDITKATVVRNPNGAFFATAVTPNGYSAEAASLTSRREAAVKAIRDATGLLFTELGADELHLTITGDSEYVYWIRL